MEILKRITAMVILFAFGTAGATVIAMDAGELANGIGVCILIAPLAWVLVDVLLELVWPGEAL